jgi:hypothetical protein
MQNSGDGGTNQPENKNEIAALEEGQAKENVELNDLPIGSAHISFFHHVFIVNI